MKTLSTITLLSVLTILHSACGSGGSSNSSNSNNNSDYPLAVKVNEYNQRDHKLEINLTTQNINDAVVEFNLYGIKLVDENGEECGPEIMDIRKPDFPVNKELYKGDKASGWLVFKYPSGTFKPEKLILSPALSTDRYAVIDINGLLNGENVDIGTLTEIDNTSKKSETYPIKGEISQVQRGRNIIHLYIKAESTVDELIKFNLYSIKLVGKEGDEADSPDIMSGKNPQFPVNKEFYKGDKAAGWLSFKYPSGSFEPEQIIFKEIMGSTRYMVLQVPTEVTADENSPETSIEEKSTNESTMVKSTGNDNGSVNSDIKLILDGNWQGDFGDKTLLLDLVANEDGTISGTNKVGENSRPVSGSFSGDLTFIEMKLSEPGDDDWDGVFEIEVSQLGAYNYEMSGTWKSNNGKISRDFTLQRQ